MRLQTEPVPRVSVSIRMQKKSKKSQTRVKDPVVHVRSLVDYENTKITQQHALKVSAGAFSVEVGSDTVGWFSEAGLHE